MNLFGLNSHTVFFMKHSQREVEAAIVDSVMAEDHQVLLKSVKKSMFKLDFFSAEMEQAEHVRTCPVHLCRLVPFYFREDVSTTNMPLLFVNPPSVVDFILFISSPTHSIEEKRWRPTRFRG